jgi:uncharacterized membrane protein YccC
MTAKVVRDVSMTRNTGLWRRLRALIARHRVHLALSIRMTIAALASYLLAQALQLPLPLWAVLTAVIVTQISVGRSLKATFDYLVGTVGGAVYGGAIGVLISYSNEMALLAGLALAVAPLALIAAVNPRFSVAPITAIIVVLIPTMTHATAISSALDRVIEVALGGFTGFFVSFLLLPANAHPLVAAAAARTLEQMAQALGELLAGLRTGLDVEALHRLQDHIGEALEQLNVVGEEAERERAARLAVGADTGPLLRTLLRLRHDLVMIGRAAASPLPDTLGIRLAAPLAQVAAAFHQYLHASAAALRAGNRPVSLAAVEAALQAYAAEVTGLRRDGVTRTLTDDAAEQFFALGFALEQMHNNFKDLGRCVAEWAEPAKETGGAKAQPG